MRGETTSPFGGWLQGSLKALALVPDLAVVVASPSSERALTSGRSEGIDYVGFSPITRQDARTDGVAAALHVLRTVGPDLVHIHGTELAHSLSFATAAAVAGIPTVVSIQGLVSVYAQHMTAHLPQVVVHGFSSRPWVRSDRVAGMRRSFEVQGSLEQETLRLTSHIIGRTRWDRVCTGDIHPSRRYHHCEETLRPSFYSERWLSKEARPHSILVGQGHYPIKGLHLLLHAMPAVLRRFPQASVTVTGHSPVEGRQTAYSRHLRSLIKDLGLEGHIQFAGPRSEVQMLEHYRATAIVACPSVIENSPNSVAESMLLGVPVVAAHVGGVPDMLVPGQEGLTYQADAPYMLADAIVTLFENPEHAAALGARARQRALIRHDPTANAARTVEIYIHILEQNNELK